MSLKETVNVNVSTDKVEGTENVSPGGDSSDYWLTMQVFYGQEYDWEVEIANGILPH